MPHQCLKCGKVFEEKSSELLKGCPVCKGNHFFYTKTPLDGEERKKINEKMGKDLNLVISNLINNNTNDIIAESNDWINVKAKTTSEAIDKHLAETKKVVADNKKNIDIITEPNYRETKIKQIKSELKKSKSPETINVEESGKYKIDVKGLLEEEPIVIQKDGSYTIHLPSVFKMIQKEKDEY